MNHHYIYQITFYYSSIPNSLKMATAANELKLYMEFWDFPQTVDAFKRIKEWLQSRFKNYELNVKSLLSFTVKLLQFQEDHFKNAPMMRIPIKFFMDLQPGGALCVMLNVALGFCRRHGWDWTEFEDNVGDEVMDMFRGMEKALVEVGLFKLPTIHLRSEVDGNVRRGLIAVAERRGWTLADCEDSASHILYPYPELLEEGSTKVIMKQGHKILVHWCYLPESYNAWYNVETSVDIEGRIAYCNKQWRLSLAWLTTSDKYNEWMDEEDYQVDEGGRKIESVGVSLEQLLKPVEASPFWHDHNYSWLPEHMDTAQENFRPTAWTPREVLRLFEAVETYRDDWLSVSGYVGTRDPHDCLLFFLRYPIEDTFLENSWQISGRHFDEGNLPYPAEQMAADETEKIKRSVLKATLLQADVLERKVRCLRRLQGFVDASFGCSQYFQEVYVAEALRSNPEMFEEL